MPRVAFAVSVLLSAVLAADRQLSTPTKEGEQIPVLELAQDPLVEKGKVANLQGIAACEAQVFGNESWYDRFGFFYVNFMAEAYRRPN